MADLSTLRVLITDERSDLLSELCRLVRAVGHEPVGCEAGVAETAAAAERHAPDVAIVGVHQDAGHALDLLGALATAGVPVVLTLEGADEQFIAEAATRGVVAQAAPLDPDTLTTALRLAHARAQELARSLTERVAQFEERVRTRAIIERAKGILMERHDLTEPDAYELLRRHARDQRQPLSKVAEAVLQARSLLPSHKQRQTRR